MSMVTLGDLLHPQPWRTGQQAAQARKWVDAQTYNVERAAKDVTTSPQILDEIATNGTTRLAQFVASNPNTDTDTLDEMWANCSNDGIAYKLAANPKTSPETLLDIFEAYNRHSTVMKRLFNNPSSPKSLIIDMLPFGWWKKDKPKLRPHVEDFNAEWYKTYWLIFTKKNVGIKYYFQNAWLLPKGFHEAFYAKYKNEIAAYIKQDLGIVVNLNNPLSVYRVIRSHYHPQNFV